ncbi:MAG: methyltransferase domain-containing protein [Phycisphaerae bacterium]|jgi:ubiquinone/menaquinone biosynthesis C-methylase UbiE|nr:methyltransferase domain-containing protein [Phycisphaerae bacterium]
MKPLKVVSAVHRRCVYGGRVARLAEAIGALCPEGPQKILDVGCGDGHIAKTLADRLGDGCEISGIDVLVRDAPAIPVTRYDGRTMPFGDDSFDTVLLIDVLHHTGDPAALLAEAARVAGGSVIVKDHVCESRLDKWLLSFMDWVGNRPHGVALEYNYLSAAEWDNCIAAAGLVREYHTANVKLYRWPLSVFFERRMHVLMKLVAAGD